MIRRSLTLVESAVINFALFLLTGFGVSLNAQQQPPLLQGVIVQNNVTSSSLLFNYSYSLTNGPPNRATISKIDIDVTLPPGGISLNNSGLENGQGFMQNIADSVLNDPRMEAVVPVALSAPPGWLTTISVDGTASWIAGRDDAVIVVGSSVKGYQITSPGLPAIRRLTVEADYDVNDLPIAPPADAGPDLVRYNNALGATLQNFRVTTITVAPTAPPANFQPVQFLLTIQDYKEQAFKQGWITNPGTANSLDAKLNAALAALQAQDLHTAKNILDALLNDVEAQAGKHLTPEAVALLQFNTQYLIKRLCTEDSNLFASCPI